jgi:hypothetical protein
MYQGKYCKSPSYVREMKHFGEDADTTAQGSQTGLFIDLLYAATLCETQPQYQFSYSESLSKQFL